MPTIAIFYGIVVQMYWRDDPPAHVHAYYQGFEALLAIETGLIIGGRFPLMPNALCDNGSCFGAPSSWKIGKEVADAKPF
jgi:hypothetical protein